MSTSGDGRTGSIGQAGERPPTHPASRDPLAGGRPGESVSPVTSPVLFTLDPSELVWMEDLREHLRPAGGPGLSLDALDAAFQTYASRWHATEPEQRWNPAYLVNALGVCLGDALVALYPDACWCALQREDGRHPAVRIDSLHATVMPINAVARRWLAGPHAWMCAWASSLADVRDQARPAR